jgi:hypothetical protein
LRWALGDIGVSVDIIVLDEALAARRARVRGDEEGLGDLRLALGRHLGDASLARGER